MINILLSRRLYGYLEPEISCVSKAGFTQTLSNATSVCSVLSAHTFGL